MGIGRGHKQGLAELSRTVSCPTLQNRRLRPSDATRSVSYGDFLPFIHLVNHSLRRCYRVPPCAGLGGARPLSRAFPAGEPVEHVHWLRQHRGRVLARGQYRPPQHTRLGAPQAAGTVRTASRAMTPKPSSEG